MLWLIKKKTKQQIPFYRFYQWYSRWSVERSPGNKKRSLSTKEETFLENILFFGHTTLPSLREILIMCPLFPHGLLFPPSVPPRTSFPTNPLYSFPLHSWLYWQQYSPTQVCFKQTILPPSFWYLSMDWRICPVPFWSRWCWSVCHMLQMQHFQFPVLFHWSNCLQLHSWNLCPQARSRLGVYDF